LENLTSHNGGFLPSGLLVGKLLALLTDIAAFMRDVKEVSRHER